MAKESKPGKEFIIGGIVLAVLVGGLGAYTLSQQSERYKVDLRIGAKKVKVDAMDKADALLAALQGNYVVEPQKVGAQPYDVFGAPILWIKPNTTTPIDIVAGAPIHGDVPNVWFLENGLSDVLKFSDALTRDTDGDGYTNEEEYVAKTNPSDADSFPDLINKLATKLHATGFRVVFSSDFAPEYGFKATDPQGNARWAEGAVKIGGIFGKGAEQGRLKLEAVVSEDVEMHGEKEKVNFAVISDLKSPVAGKEYKVRVGSKYSELIVDSSATFTVNAGPKAGESFKVKEGATFTIPGQADFKYILESIDRKAKNALIKSANDGSTETWTLSE